MKKVTIALAALFIALLVVCCFFQTPTFDDFVPADLVAQLGLRGAISFYLQQANSRFSSIPLFITLGASRYLLSHYWIALVFFLLSAMAAYAFLLKNLLASFSSHSFRPVDVFLGASLLQLVFLTSIAEPSSFYFWMASATTYLFGFILLLLLTGLVLKYTGTNNTLASAAGIVLLKVIIAGSIEIALAYSLYITALLLLTDIRRRQLRGLSFACLLGDAIGISLFFFLPGGAKRADHFGIKHDLLSSIGGSLERTGKIFVPVFSNPVFWLSLAAVYFLAAATRRQQREALLKNRWPLIIEALLVAAPVFALHFVVRLFGNEVLPPRAENLLITLSVLAVAWVAYRYFLSMAPLSPAFFDQYQRPLAIIAALAVLSAPFIRDIPENLFTLPFHKKVVDQRVKNIVSQKATGKNSAVLAPYHDDMKKAMAACRFSPRNYVFRLPPSFTYFKDDPYNSNTDYIYAGYYQIDTIITQTGMVLSHPVFIAYPASGQK